MLIPPGSSLQDRYEQTGTAPIKVALCTHWSLGNLAFPSSPQARVPRHP